MAASWEAQRCESEQDGKDHDVEWTSCLQSWFPDGLGKCLSTHQEAIGYSEITETWYLWYSISLLIGINYTWLGTSTVMLLVHCVAKLYGKCNGQTKAEKEFISLWCAFAFWLLVFKFYKQFFFFFFWQVYIALFHNSFLI